MGPVSGTAWVPAPLHINFPLTSGYNFLIHYHFVYVGLFRRTVFLIFVSRCYRGYRPKLLVILVVIKVSTSNKPISNGLGLFVHLAAVWQLRLRCTLYNAHCRYFSEYVGPSSHSR